MPEHDEMLERGIELLREPVVIDDGLDARVMGAIAGLPAPARSTSLQRAATWLIRPRPIRVRPVAALAAAGTTGARGQRCHGSLPLVGGG